MPETARSSATQTTVFKSGNSQAVRIPKDFRFDSDTVWLNRVGHRVYISAEPLSALDVLTEITNGLSLGWADGLEEPPELPVDDIPAWDEQ